MLLVFILEDVKDVRQSFVSILQVLKEKFFLVHVPIIEIIMGLVIPDKCPGQRICSKTIIDSIIAQVRKKH
jgi:hypothetical protein